MPTVIFKGHASEVLAALNSQLDMGMEIVGSAATQHAKDMTPVRTGNLRDSINNRPSGKHGQEIGTKVEYAGYVELGTRKMRAQPYLRPAAENYADEYVNIIRNVLGG